MRKFALAAFLAVFAPVLIAQQSMNNDSVIKLCKAGLSDDVIVTTINSSQGDYKTAPDDLVALKTAGASDKVVAAVVVKASAPMVTAVPAAAVGGGLPAGIDEVGVYYKDKSGAWVALMPEIVNFKTGGAMKSFMTNGLVKGDINGHINGKHAKTEVTFPAVLAVYVPEGTAITVFPTARSGIARDRKPSSGASLGQMTPTVPMGSFMAMAILRNGGLWTAPSNLSAHAA